MDGKQLYNQRKHQHHKLVVTSRIAYFHQTDTCSTHQFSTTIINYKQTNLYYLSRQKKILLLLLLPYLFILLRVGFSKNTKGIFITSYLNARGLYIKAAGHQSLSVLVTRESNFHLVDYGIDIAKLISNIMVK